MRYLKEERVKDAGEQNWRRTIRKILKARAALWWNIVEENCESFEVFMEYF